MVGRAGPRRRPALVKQALAARTVSAVRMRGWLVDVLLLVLLAALTAALAAGALLDLDIAVRDWVDAHRPQPWYVAARALNYLGQGGALVVVALLAAAWLARRAH